MGVERPEEEKGEGAAGHDGDLTVRAERHDSGGNAMQKWEYCVVALLEKDGSPVWSGSGTCLTRCRKFTNTGRETLFDGRETYEQMKERARIEKRKFVEDDVRGAVSRTFHAFLAGLGDDGWELVSHAGGDGTSSTQSLYFKRPKA